MTGERIAADTTYRPARLALGRFLSELGRREEATILALTFFTDFGPGHDVGGPGYYRDHHIRQILDDLKTDHLDCLVVHRLQDPGENLRQLELVVSWKEQGLVGRLETWDPGNDEQGRFGSGNPRTRQSGS